MKKSISVLGLLVLSTLAWSITADEVIQKMKDQNKQDTAQARIAATIEEKGGATSERLIDQFYVTENNLRKSVAVFQKPASVKDTRFLILENAGRDEDRWIYLPSLKKVRRISASEGGNSFIGEISYDDISVGGSSEGAHTLLPDQKIQDQEVYVVKSIPKDPGDSQYSQVIAYVSKISYLPLRVEMFDKQGKLLKTAEALEVKQLQGVWSIMKLKMSNVQNGNATTLTFQILEYGKKIPPGVFTTKYLETGRP